MDEILTELFALSNLIFCLMVWILTWTTRKIINLKFASLESHKIYKELILPLSPIVIGMLLALCVPMYPFPTMLSSLSGHVLFGGVSGLASAHAYKILKKFVKKAADEENTPDDPNQL